MKRVSWLVCGFMMLAAGGAVNAAPPPTIPLRITLGERLAQDLVAKSRIAYPEVKDLIQNECRACHRAEGKRAFKVSSFPFSFASKQTASEIADAIRQRINSDDEKFRMPRFGKKLHPLALESLNQWLDAGMPATSVEGELKPNETELWLSLSADPAALKKLSFDPASFSWKETVPTPAGDQPSFWVAVKVQGSDLLPMTEVKATIEKNLFGDPNQATVTVE